MSEANQQDGGTPPTATALAEASVWLARLMRPNRTSDIDAGFQRWLNESPEHARAFEHTQDAWHATDGLVRRCVRPRFEWTSSSFTVKRWRHPLVIGVVAVSLASMAGALIMARLVTKEGNEISTGVGERTARVLPDGSRVELNTDTRLQVEYTPNERRVRLDHGEALFQVAKNANYPFIVIAGDRAVRALGTQFLVRHDARELSVTLVDGKVSVAPAGLPAGSGASERPTLLTPGERLVFDTKSAATIDRPALDRIKAWQYGEVSMDDMPLADAVAEMNRYSKQRLVVEDPRMASIHVTGIFRAGDLSAFARAVEHMYQIQVVEDGREIRLVGARHIDKPQ